MTQIDIGMGKSARRAYHLDDITVVPSRRTRDREEVDISWQLDGYRFDLPVIGAAMDGVTSPEVCADLSRQGALGVLHLEGLWARHDDPAPLLAELAEVAEDKAVARLRDLYAAPISGELIASRVAGLKEIGVTAAGALTPQQVERWHDVALKAGLDILVIEGTVVSAEHLSTRDEPLDLKRFIARYDLPVIVGGCASYATALHLMRTGAAGVLVGIGTGTTSSTRQALGLSTPLATAIADAAGARSRHLEETGRNVQIIANGGMRTGGDVAKAIACGADAVMLGTALAASSAAPAAGAVWGMFAGHDRLPRGRFSAVDPVGSLAEVLTGPSSVGDGTANLCGGLRRAMATAGYGSLKAFQRADIVVDA